MQEGFAEGGVEELFLQFTAMFDEFVSTNALLAFFERLPNVIANAGLVIKTEFPLWTILFAGMDFSLQKISTTALSIPRTFSVMVDQIIASLSYLNIELRKTADLVRQVQGATGVGSSSSTPTETTPRAAFGMGVVAGRQYEILEPEMNVPFEIFQSAESGRSFFFPRENGEIISPLAGSGTQLSSNLNVPETVSQNGTFVINNNMQVSVPVTVENGSDINIDEIQSRVIEAVGVVQQRANRSNPLVERLNAKGLL